jgi:hypothetical protein
MPRCRFQPNQWAQWIQDHSVSNLSVADFCAIHQLPVHSFYFWRRKLASHSKPKELKNLADARLAENALQFIPLQLQGLNPEVTVDLRGGLILDIPVAALPCSPFYRFLFQVRSMSES